MTTTRARSRAALLVLVGESVRAVLRHKSRSALTALGITIGIAAVAWVVAIGRAGQERTEDPWRAARLDPVEALRRD